MEKTLENTKTILDKNEKVIANILHDIKSPLYSIKIGLQQKLDNELNKDVYNVAVNLINYIENFLVNYSFEKGKFEEKVELVNVKEIINQKLESVKYLFMSRNLFVDIIQDNGKYTIDTIKIFLSSIISNIISNIAIHGAENTRAIIELKEKDNYIVIDFINKYNIQSSNFNLGLDFSKELSKKTKIEIKFEKTKDTMKVNLKIPNLIN